MANLVQSLTPARALRRRRVRVPRQVLVGLLLVAVAVGGGLRWSYTVNSGREVIVAVREVPAGATIAADDLATARVAVGDLTYHAAFPASDLVAVIGKTAVERMHSGQIVVHAQVGEGLMLPPGAEALTIPVTGDAVGGSIRAGDAVQVLVTTDRGRPDSKTVVVLDRATVYAVARAGAGTLGAAATAAGGGDEAASAGTPTALTLIVAPEQALALANARWNGDLEVALLPPVGAGR